jgi:hypothetical protein
MQLRMNAYPESMSPKSAPSSPEFFPLLHQDQKLQKNASNSIRYLVPTANPSSKENSEWRKPLAYGLPGQPERGWLLAPMGCMVRVAMDGVRRDGDRFGRS